MITAQTTIMEGILRRLALLERRVEILAAAEGGGAWRPVPYTTGWVDFTESFDYAAGTYKRVGDLVLLSGQVTRSSGSSAIIATLAADCHPSERHILTCISNGAISRVDVHTDGTINLLSGTTSSYISLSGQFFRL